MKRTKTSGWIAFHKDHPGWLIDDDTLKLIMDAAKRGKITQAGKDLILVPDKRYGPADASGLRSMHSVRKSECVPLTSLCPLGKDQEPTPSVTETSGKVRNEASVHAGSRGRKQRIETRLSRRPFSPLSVTCQQCGELVAARRQSKKYCSSKCRKRAQRMEE